MADDDAPEFGPSGYLPPRAAGRARKIVLRAPLGLQWFAAALLLGGLLVGAAIVFVYEERPAPPFERVAVDITTLDASQPLTVGGLDTVLVATGGRLRVLVAPFAGEVPTWCPDSGLLESSDGGAWRATGRGVQGTPSLVELATVLADGALWVDPTTRGAPPRPDEAGPTPACGVSPS